MVATYSDWQKKLGEEGYVSILNCIYNVLLLQKQSKRIMTRY